VWVITISLDFEHSWMGLVGSAHELPVTGVGLVKSAGFSVYADKAFPSAAVIQGKSHAARFHAHQPCRTPL
jgi:hypothetical protein